jgi:hypothetical protein
MGNEFAPKDAETLKSEFLTELGVEYEGNEETIDKLVARGLKDEDFKASLHADKTKHLTEKREKEELLKKAGLDPKTGEKVASKEGNGEDKTSKNEVYSLSDIRALADVHDDDVSEIVNLAKIKGISIAEAKKEPYIQTYLNTRAEERKTAQVAATGATKRGENKSGDLLKKVENQEDMSEDEMKSAARQMIDIAFNKK